MRVLRHTDPDFKRQLAKLDRRAEPDEAVRESVREILQAVRERGDRAVLEFARKFDRASFDAAGMRVTPAELQAAADIAPVAVKKAIRAAHRNVRQFARASLRKNWMSRNAQGARVGERFDPFPRVGIYVPAGTAPLASTVIMTVTFAAAAGVPEIVVVTPVKGDEVLHPGVAYALQLAGATEVYKIGGAQAIGALAYGTASIRPVAKIFGPGNPWVVEAKRQVFGTVAIDLLPGPSEVLVLADTTANPRWIAADLLAQAEHGHGSMAVLVTPSHRLLEKVQSELARQAATLSRADHLAHVLEEETLLVQVRNLQQGIDLANRFAAEHVSVVVKDVKNVAAQLTTSGALFLGGWSPVAAGDFLAGPSHTLPTGGAAKSFAGLTAEQFQRRTSIVQLDEVSLRKSASMIETFSEMEGLDAHGHSAAIRLSR